MVYRVFRVYKVYRVNRVYRVYRVYRMRFPGLRPDLSVSLPLSGVQEGDPSRLSK